MGCQHRSRPIIERAIQVSEHFQCRPLRCFGYEPRNLAPIADENDLLLLVLNATKDGAEVARNLGDGERGVRQICGYVTIQRRALSSDRPSDY